MNIKKLNKVELHRHLDCSMRFSKMVEIANKHGFDIPKSSLEQRKHFLLTEPLTNLKEVLLKFESAQKLLFSYEILEELAYDTVIESSNENTKLLELRYSPYFIQSAHPLLDWDGIHQAFVKGIQRAQIQKDIGVGIILIFQRTLSPKILNDLADFAINNKSSLIGVDLADSEDGYPALQFEALFNRLKTAGLRVTIHAGEIPTNQSIKNIEESILFLGAERIGHGIQAIQSERVIKLLIDKKIPLEVCPTSNYLTQAISKRNEHPLRKLVDEGVLVTINTDDPGIFDYTLEQELNFVQNDLQFSLNELKDFQRTAFTHSFISDTLKRKYESYFI